MTVQFNTNIDMLNTGKVTGMANGTADNDAVNVSQLNAAIEGIAWKDSARVASTANLNLASPGSSIDSISLSSGDRVLVKDQTLPAANGIYIWNGSAVAMTRSLDASTFDELEQAVITVEEGTSAGATFRQTAVNGTIGVTSVTWTTFGTSVPSASESTAGIAEIATQTETDTGTDDTRFVTPLKLATYSGKAKRYAAAFGDGSATSYAITHNLGTRDVVVEVYRASGNYDKVLTDVEHTDTNTVTIKTVVAPTTNAYRCVVVA